MKASAFRKLIVEGDPRTRGQVHGESLRTLVREHYGRWLEAIGNDLGCDPETYVRNFLSKMRFGAAIERWAPGLLEEVRGISEGAGVPLDIALARQLSDEEPWYRRSVRLSRPSHAGCSSIGSRSADGGQIVIAQNMDMPDYCDGFQVMLHVCPSGGLPESLVFTLAGKISLAGMNSAGLAMACNTLSQLDYSKEGLPEDFVVRTFLEHSCFEDACGFLESVDHASGQNYTVGAPGATVVNYECSARSARRFVPVAPPGCVFHTNHPFVNTDTEKFALESSGLSDAELARYYYGSSYPRFAELQAQLAGLDAAPTISQIKAALSSHAGPVCRHGSEIESRRDNYTVGCLIMELAPVLTFHVAPGPPCETDFLSFGFQS